MSPQGGGGGGGSTINSQGIRSPDHSQYNTGQRSPFK